MGSSGSQTANLKCLPPYIGPPISLHRPTKQSFGLGIQNLNWRIGVRCSEQILASFSWLASLARSWLLQACLLVSGWDFLRCESMVRWWGLVWTNFGLIFLTLIGFVGKGLIIATLPAHLNIWLGLFKMWVYDEMMRSCVSKCWPHFPDSDWLCWQGDNYCNPACSPWSLAGTF